ncbi:MAG: tetratricopeptide repeat protein [Chloroflexota bacterium]
MRALVLLIILLAFPRPLYSQSAAPADLFAKAYALYTNGQHAEARELFQKTLDADFHLADYSLYYLAAIAFDESDWNDARGRLSELKLRFPQSLWSHPGALLQAKIEIAEQQYVQAGEILRGLRTNMHLKRDIANEALYLDGRVQEYQGEAQRAYALYDELRDSAPTSRWTAAARKAQKRLREAYPEMFPLPTIEMLADEADRLARERQTDDAEILYRKLLNNVTEADFRLRLLSRLAGLYLSVRKRDEALPVLQQIAREYPETGEAPKALFQIAQILWNRHDNAAALGYFKIIIEQYPASPQVGRALFAAADIHEFFGRKDEAVQLYERIIKSSPQGPLRDDARWRLAWLYYNRGEPAAAMATFRALARQSRTNAFAIAALYWQARSTEKVGDAESAVRVYRRIVNGGGESYYQDLALRGLERLGAPYNEPKAVVPKMVEEPDPPMTDDVAFHLVRARDLAELSLHQLAVAELDEINDSKPNARLRMLLMREYFRNRAYGRSLKFADQLPSSQSERDLYRFPLAFWDLIQQKAREREIDPYLVLALIRQESLFDARARSPAAALGLMQLIPPTAARVAKQLGLAAPSQERLYEPEVNLTLGTQYLKDLLQRYSNNWYKALAAYNAGEAAVDRWEKELATDDIEEFVERIPYVETRGYVKLVMRNHRIYKRLYALQK